MTKIATCCFLALAAVNAALEWTNPPVRSMTIDERAGR
jgi:hypothetical protein